jgi:NAD(P)-dependent dehydrogenase (short-subunit alcohol dehydrogenase family)
VTWLASQILPEGRTNCRVNNLGGSRNAKIWEMAVGDFDFVLRLNLRSTFLVTRAAAPHMMKRRQGRIICLSSGQRRHAVDRLLPGRGRLLDGEGRCARLHP